MAKARQETERTALATKKLTDQLTLYQQRMLGVGGLKGELDIFADKNKGRYDESALKQIRTDVEGLTASTPDLNNKIKQTGNQLNLLKQESQEAGNVMTRAFENAFKFLRFYLVGGMLVRFIGSFRQAIDILREVDDQLIQLRKVSGLTMETMNDFAFTANEIASAMGATTAQVIEQVTAWSRLGYQLEEASKLAENSILLSVVGNMDVNRATEGLVSTMKAFNLTADDSIEAINMINKLGNEFALSQEDAIGILQRSSAAMREANNSLAETLALGVGAQEIQQDSARVGTALRTVSIKFKILVA